MDKNQNGKMFSIWLKKHYLFLIILTTSLYLLLAFMAPIFMKLDLHVFAEALYRLFSNVCHQYAHRSWFLFGRQAYYPINANQDFLSASEAFNLPIADLSVMRNIIGDSVNGYKVAICQRDVAIYSAFLLSTFIFLLSRRQLNPLPLSIWFLFAVIPMGVDGTWQLLGNLDWLQFLNLSHESTPLLRTVTGGLFGFFSGWYLLSKFENT